MTKKDLQHIAIIVAAGKGLRAGGDVPKQYQLLEDMPVLAHSIRAFAENENITKIVVVIADGDQDQYEQAISTLNPTHHIKLLPPVIGGASRQHSVRNGLHYVRDCVYKNAIIHIHDAARCLVNQHIINQCTEFMNSAPMSTGCLVALPVVDTIKRTTENHIGEFVVQDTIDRSALWRAQTPQSFHLDALLHAYAQIDDLGQMTDDTMIAEKCGMKICMITGDEQNFKITTPKDFALARIMLQNKTDF